MQSRGLGKGLGALLSEETLGENFEEQMIRVEDIDNVEPNYNQPRKNFNEEELRQLSLSIKEHGILQPLIVRTKGDKYQIVAGERRYRAARIAGLTEIPIMIKDCSDQTLLEMALVENIQREDLNIMELANAYNLLAERFDLTQEQIADKIGKSRSAVANIMRLLNLAPYVQEKVREDMISFGHARAILSLKDMKMQKEVTDFIIEKQLSVRETEKYIQTLLQPATQKKKQEITSNPFYKEIQENLQKLLGTKVVISKNAKKGKIEIEYYSDEELSRIIQCIKPNK